MKRSKSNNKDVPSKFHNLKCTLNVTNFLNYEVVGELLVVGVCLSISGVYIKGNIGNLPNTTVRLFKTKTGTQDNNLFRLYPSLTSMSSGIPNEPNKAVVLLG